MKTIGNAWRESTTFRLVLSAWIPVLLRYLLGGFDIGYGTVPIMSATEFATAFAAITAVWLAREWRVTHYAGKD